MSPPTTILLVVRREGVPYVASAQTREQNGSRCFRATGGIRLPHRWHATRAAGLCACLRTPIIIVVSSLARINGPPPGSPDCQ